MTYSHKTKCLSPDLLFFYFYCGYVTMFSSIIFRLKENKWDFRILSPKGEKINFPFDNRKSGQLLCFLFRSNASIAFLAFCFLITKSSGTEYFHIQSVHLSFFFVLHWKNEKKKGWKKEKKIVNKEKKHTERVYRHITIITDSQRCQRCSNSFCLYFANVFFLFFWSIREQLSFLDTKRWKKKWVRRHNIK